MRLLKLKVTAQQAPEDPTMVDIEWSEPLVQLLAPGTMVTKVAVTFENGTTLIYERAR